MNDIAKKFEAKIAALEDASSRKRDAVRGLVFSYVEQHYHPDKDVVEPLNAELRERMLELGFLIYESWYKL